MYIMLAQGNCPVNSYFCLSNLLANTVDIYYTCGIHISLVETVVKRSDGSAYFLRSGYANLFKRSVDSAEVNSYSDRELQFGRGDSEERRSVSVATIRVNIGA